LDSKAGTVNQAVAACKFCLLAALQTRALNSMKVLPHTHSCFVCGESNPVALKLLFHTDGRVVQTRFTARSEHIGFKGIVHGGLISTVLDELMVWACAVQTKRFAFCAELNVRFLNSLRPNQEALVTGELVTNRKDRIYEAKAELKNAGGEILASATGKYVPVPGTNIAEMATDFVDDPTWVFEK